MNLTNAVFTINKIAPPQKNLHGKWKFIFIKRSCNYSIKMNSLVSEQNKTPQT